MRLLGLLGGMSWESSAEYYRLANELVRDRLGGFHSARLVLYSVDFDQIERLQREARWDEAGRLLADGARALEQAGAELLLLCTNTMHTVAQAVQAATSVPLLHIADATAAAVKQAGLDQVGLLGTGFTMEQPFLRERLEQAGLRVVLPDPPDRELVHRVIYDELVMGVIREASRERYRQVIAWLVERGAQGVILGCTEIELLIGDDDATVPLFPTTRLHVQAAIDAALTARRPPAALRRELNDEQRD
jgi:aspartate racemase